MDVVISWKRLTPQNSSDSRVLYANINSISDEIVYIGKADFCSVDERLNGRDKESLYRHYEKIGIIKVRTIVGYIGLEEQKRLSQELLSDIESLLIKRIKPTGNVQSLKSRISRPGMRIFCEGNWPLEKATFIDK